MTRHDLSQYAALLVLLAGAWALVCLFGEIR